MNTRAREAGQGLVEYALILVLIAVVVIVILTILGGSVAMVYARVAAGLNGQVLTGVGEEYVVTSFDSTYSHDGAGNCTAAFSNITLIALQNGSANSSTNVTVPVSINGSSAGSIPATTNGSGIASAAGPYSFGGTCPLNVNLGGRNITSN